MNKRSLQRTMTLYKTRNSPMATITFSIQICPIRDKQSLVGQNVPMYVYRISFNFDRRTWNRKRNWF